MNDLIMNDEGIIPDAPTCVRTYFAGRRDVIQILLEILTTADLENCLEYTLREYTLKIWFRLYQVERSLEQCLLPVLITHRIRIDETMKMALAQGSDCDLYRDEIELVDEVISAPTRPIISNYEKAKPQVN